MNQEQLRLILDAYKQQTENTKEAMRLAGVPAPLIALYTFNLPNLDNILPDDAINLFKQFREMVILYLHHTGFSKREIVRRVGGPSLFIVQNAIKQLNDDKKTVRLDEVSIKN